ncbi:uncharacterized protein LOC129942854 isoform X1 [Eupeodes corollae]|uniref:uncharacterized protein LOC129942854 isoform X1 n=1 Tax=Eupeodes corollae TaxID=290404 RepID=UPI002492440B|nr:uncharacterized protein LOC129942854 isoform X1 [Eupeodes corollae]XP_055907927.1 uncharacterized protein LOC129942854 isoform X1 [Eupeodes corollae]
MNLEKLIQIFLEQAKKQILTLCDTERTIACQWLKKIELVPNQDSKVKNLQLHSLKLLLLTIESKLLVGPFEESPIENKTFTDYDWDSYKLEDFSNMIRSKRDSQKRPEVSYAVSSDRRELVTYQNDPATGQHCYYACSKQPIEEWNNLEGGVIKNQSIGQWKERAEYEELNGKESRNSSVDEPRCEMQATNSQIILNDEQFQNSSLRRSQRVPNFSNINTDPSVSSRHTNYQRNNVERPETPQRFGGRGQTMRPYEMEQFGLSQNEQFRSPRGVFQNLDYDRFQAQRSPMPPRLTDEIIESFENARTNRSPLNEDNQNNYEAKQQLCRRLQKIRDEMNKKPQAKIEQEIEVEPEIIPCQRITLHEPCEDTIHQQHETDQDLGILSARDMDDEVLFGEHQTIDPRTIFKNKDENLVSRNVVKIETNTTIDGNKREVVEEFLEQDHVNVVDRTENEENLVDVSEPTFESFPGYSPLRLNENSWKNVDQWKCKPRRVLADYSDLPQEDLEDISKPSFQQRSFEEQDACKIEHMSGEEERFYSGRQQDASGRVNLPGSERFCRGYERALSQRDNSERLENVSEPIYASSFENSGTRTTSGLGKGIKSCRRLPQVEVSERLDEVSQPSFLHSTEVSHQDSRQRSRCRMPQVQTSERLDDVSQPGFASSLADTYQSSTRKNACPFSRRGMPQFEPSERLDEVSQPSFLHSAEVSHQDSRQRSRCRMPQVQTSERLDDVSQPGFASSFEDTYQSSTRKNACPFSKRGMPQFEPSERLDEVSQPSFLHSAEASYQDSRQRSRCQTSQRPGITSMTSERLDEVSHPDFALSFEDSCKSSARRNQCPLSKRCITQVEDSERLDDVSQPSFLHSTEVSHPDSRQRCIYRVSQREPTENLDEVSHPEFASSLEATHGSSLSSNRCPIRRRGMPKVDTSERLDQVTHPSFMSSFQDSSVSYRQRRDLNQISGSERLDNISQPEFLHSTAPSFQDSNRRTSCPVNRRQLRQETSELLDEVSQPSFLCSAENTFQDSAKRIHSPSVYPSERLDEISHPSFMASYQDSTGPPRQSRGMLLHKRLPEFDISENLDEVSQPEFLHSTEASFQDNSKRIRCPRPLPQMQTSENLDQVSCPQFLSSIEDSFQNAAIRGRSPIGRRQFPQIDTCEKLDDISKPSFSASLQDSTGPSRRYRHISPKSCRPLVETSEILDEVSQPEFLHSTEASFQDNSKRIRCPRPLPQMETSENLDQISCPQFLSSVEDSFQNAAKRGRSPIARRHLPQIDTCEKLDDISKPSFGASLQDSTGPSRRYRHISPKSCRPLVETSEILDEVSQPEFLHSTEASLQDNSKRIRCPRPLPQMETSENLDQISCPQFLSSIEGCFQNAAIRGRSLVGRRHFPQIETCEKLDDISKPSFGASLQDSTGPSRRYRHISPKSCRPLVETSEMLDEVSQPEFLHSTEASLQDNSKRIRCPRPLPQMETSENLDQISCPQFLSSIEGSFQNAAIRGRSPMGRRHFPQIETCEKLDDISKPSFGASLQDSTGPSRRYRHISPKSCRPSVETSEILDEVSQPEFLQSMESSHQRTRSPMNRKPIYQEMTSERLDQISQPRYLSSIDSTNDDCRRKCKLLQVNVSENLADVSQPFCPSSFEDSTQRSREVQRSERLEDISQPNFLSSYNNSTLQSKGRPLPDLFNNTRQTQSGGFENLEDVCQPSFQSSLEESNQGPKQSIQRHTQSPRQKLLSRLDRSELLEDISQPCYPSSFEDSMRNRDRRPIPQVSGSEYLDNVSQPGFQSTFDDSRHTPRKMQRNQTNNLEELNDISQPTFPTSFEDSIKSTERAIVETPKRRPFPLIDVSEELEGICQPSFGSCFEDSSSIPRRQRPFPQVDNSERLNDISEPDFATTFESSAYPSERLDDVCQPSFPSSFDDSRRYSRGRETSQNRESVSRQMQQNRISRRLPIEFDTSEMLENVIQPEFPSSFQETSNVSRERKIINRPMPQIDLSENIDSICQPDFPSSFNNSTRNEGQNVPCTYRKKNDYMTSFPVERVMDISAPRFHSSYEDSMQRARGSSYLPRENLEDISCPSFQTTPKLPSRSRRQDYQCPGGPARQLFPRRDSRNRDQMERSGDFRKVFEEMPNYAPFEQQVAPKRNPITSKLKRPVNFGCPISYLPKHNEVRVVNQCRRSQSEERPNAGNLNACRMRPPVVREANPPSRNRMQSRRPGPTLSSTRIPLPPSARGQEQRTKMEKQENQERLIKKSSVKFHQTKSTFFKNNQDQGNRNQRR